MGRRPPVPPEAKMVISALRDVVSSGLSAARLEESPLLELDAVVIQSGQDAPRVARVRVFIDYSKKSSTTICKVKNVRPVGCYLH